MRPDNASENDWSVARSSIDPSPLTSTQPTALPICCRATAPYQRRTSASGDEGEGEAAVWIAAFVHRALGRPAVGDAHLQRPVPTRVRAAIRRRRRAPAERGEREQRDCSERSVFRYIGSTVLRGPTRSDAPLEGCERDRTTASRWFKGSAPEARTDSRITRRRARSSQAPLGRRLHEACSSETADENSPHAPTRRSLGLRQRAPESKSPRAPPPIARAQIAANAPRTP